MRLVFWLCALAVVVVLAMGQHGAADAAAVLSVIGKLLGAFPFALFGFYGMPGFIAAMVGCLIAGVILGFVKIAIAALRQQ